MRLFWTFNISAEQASRIHDVERSMAAGLKSHPSTHERMGYFIALSFVKLVIVHSTHLLSTKYVAPDVCSHHCSHMREEFELKCSINKHGGSDC